MSGYIASCVVHGTDALITEAQNRLDKALSELGPDAPLAFLETAYYLPATLGITGRPIEKLKHLDQALRDARDMLAAAPSNPSWTPYADETLNAGIATLIAAEAIEALRWIELQAPQRRPTCSLETRRVPNGRCDRLGGPIDDNGVRSLGIGLAEGRMPGLAVIIGRAESSAVASRIIEALRRINILCFVAGNVNGRSIIHQLQEEGVELGTDARIVPLGTQTTSAVHAIGFVTRAAMTFGRLRPGMSREILDYSRKRLPGFALSLGPVDDFMLATAAGAMCFGLPLIADSDLPGIAPANGTTAAHVVPMPFERLEGADDLGRAEALVEKCIQVRGLQVKRSKVELPIPCGPAYEEESVRDGDLRVQFGGAGSGAFELLRAADLNEVTDGLVEVIGPDISKMQPAGQMNLGLVVEVAGRRMRADFEPFLERQMHGFLNGARGIEHRGRRDGVQVRISNAAAESGVNLDSLGEILLARFHEDYGAIVERIQVRVVTDPSLQEEWLQKARASYELRDERLTGLTDAGVEEFYSCTVCRSVMPDHVCVVSPERPGPCGAYNWSDCKSISCIDPGGPIQPIKVGKPIDPGHGNWDSINRRVARDSRGVVSQISMYSIMQNPPTAGSCAECVVMLIPEANGVMIVSREDRSMTPSGLTFSALSEIVSSGEQTPGVMGIGKSYLVSPKFISADGGFRRVVWMSSVLKKSMSNELRAVCEREGDPAFLDKIADERSVTTVHELLPWLEQHDHPTLALAPVF